MDSHPHQVLIVIETCSIQCRNFSATRFIGPESNSFHAQRLLCRVLLKGNTHLQAQWVYSTSISESALSELISVKNLFNHNVFMQFVSGRFTKNCKRPQIDTNSTNGLNCRGKVIFMTSDGYLCLYKMLRFLFISFMQSGLTPNRKTVGTGKCFVVCFRTE